MTDADDIEGRMRALAGASGVRLGKGWDEVAHGIEERERATWTARNRLEAAALAIGDCYLAGIDPGWGESNELEQAAILYTEAVRAESGR